MKNFFLVLIFFLFSSTSLFAEYRLEPVNCTLKKNLTVERIFIIAKQDPLIFVIQQNAPRY